MSILSTASRTVLSGVRVGMWACSTSRRVMPEVYLPSGKLNATNRQESWMSQEEAADLKPTSGPTLTVAADTLIQSITEIPVPEEQPQPMPNEQFDTDIVVIGAG